jgi:hypothetical protein
VATHVFVDYAAPLTRFPSLGRMLGRLASQPHAPDVICLGSSRMVGALLEDTGKILGAMAHEEREVLTADCALSGVGLRSQELILSHVLAMGARPRVAILEVAPDLLADSTLFKWNVGSRHLALAELPFSMGWKDLPELAYQSAHRAALPLHYYRSSLSAQAYALARTGKLDYPLSNPRPSWQPALAAHHEAPSALRWEDLLHEPPPEEDTPQRAALINDIRTSWRKLHASWAPKAEMDACVERMARRLQELGAQVILLECPVTSTFRRIMPAEKRAEYLAHVEDLSRRLGCKYVDASAWLPDCYFKDSHHVAAGAMSYYSRLLVKRAVLPVWEQGRGEYQDATARAGK